jgi:hypothetical protein
VSAVLGMGLSVNIHVDAKTLIESSLLPVGERLRPVLHLDGGRGHVSVFADRSELMRLRDAVDSVLADLDSAETQDRESAA